MEQDVYLEQRVEEQAKWYCDKSSYNQAMHKWLRGIEVFCAVLIPFIAGSGMKDASLIVGFLGVIVAVCAGIASQNKYQENWLAYRATSEQLKHQKFLFLTKTTPYNDETTAFQHFVSNVESLLSNENSQWQQNHKSKPATGS